MTAPAKFSVEVQYAALRESAVLVDRSTQGWVRVTGQDRLTWLNNLCTNQVKTLQPGEGCDAFCTNVKGRILFELSIYVGRDELFLSLDRSRLPVALPHLDKYMIADDVQLADLTQSVGRVGLMGPKAADLLATFGLSNAPAMADHQHAGVKIGSALVLVSKSHFAGPVGFDLVTPAEQLAAVVAELQRVAPGGGLGGEPLLSISADVLDIARVEAGRGAWGREITEDALPNETAQEVRCVNFTKGCYLGQEIIIRIAHQGTPAKYLRGLVVEPTPNVANEASEKPGGTGFPACVRSEKTKFFPPLSGFSEASDALPPVGAEVCSKNDPAGLPAGHLTSVVRSPRRGVLALAYLKRGVYETLPALEVTNPATGQRWSAQAVALPFVPDVHA